MGWKVAWLGVCRHCRNAGPQIDLFCLPLYPSIYSYVFISCLFYVLTQKMTHTHRCRAEGSEVLCLRYGVSRKASSAHGFQWLCLHVTVQGLPQPGITYLFQGLCKEIIMRNPKKVGYSGLRQTLDQSLQSLGFRECRVSRFRGLRLQL